MAPPPPESPPPATPQSPPVVSNLKIIKLLLRILTAVILVITVIVLSTNNATIRYEGLSLKIPFKKVYAYRYMLSAAVIGLVYAVIQLFFTISQFATGIIYPFNYQLDFYGDKIISYLVATGSAAGFGVTKDLKDVYMKILTGISTDPVEEFFSRGYASASLLLFAFICLAALSVFSSFAITKQPI